MGDRIKHRYVGKMAPTGEMWCEICEFPHKKLKHKEINESKGKAEIMQLSPIMRKYVVGLMTHHGRDLTKCEECSEPIAKGKFEIHHTKYEGAAYKDLRIVCKKCNVKTSNRLLS